MPTAYETTAVATNKPATITREYEGMTFVFREDGYFNMTKAAKAFGKRLQNFLDNEETRSYLAELDTMLNHSNHGDKEVLMVQRGNGNLPTVGTWGHPKLATVFARWLDARFAVFCDMAIDDILRGNAELVITKPAQSAVAAAPQSYLESLEQLLVSLRENESFIGIIPVKALTTIPLGVGRVPWTMFFAHKWLAFPTFSGPAPK